MSEARRGYAGIPAARLARARRSAFARPRHRASGRASNRVMIRARRGWTTPAALGGATLVVVAVGLLAGALPLRLYLLGALAVLALPAGLEVGRTTDAHERRWREALLAGGALAGLIAPTLWVLTHPLVHVDNATGATIQLWIDGERGPLLPPGEGDREPPRLRVPRGSHRFGWSAPGERAPREETRAEVFPLDEHLYNPAGAGCYWIEAAAYGDEETRGSPHGPQRIAAFYRFDRVDVWFASPPAEARVARALRGARRIALQRHRACMELAQLGCGRSLRAGFVACERTFTGPGEPIDCATIARAACTPTAAVDAASAKGAEPGRAGGRPQGGDGTRAEQ